MSASASASATTVKHAYSKQPSLPPILDFFLASLALASSLDCLASFPDSFHAFTVSLIILLVIATSPFFSSLESVFRTVGIKQAKIALKPDVEQDKIADKEAAKQAKADIKEAAKSEKLALKQAAKSEKTLANETSKAEKLALKEAAKSEKTLAKQTAKSEKLALKEAAKVITRSDDEFVEISLEDEVSKVEEIVHKKKLLVVNR